MKNLIFSLIVLNILACSEVNKKPLTVQLGTKRNEISKRLIQSIEVIFVRQPRDLKDLEKFGYRNQGVEENTWMQEGVIGIFQNNTDSTQYIFMTSYKGYKELFLPRTVRGVEENDTLFHFSQNLDGHYICGSRPNAVEEFKPREKKELYISCCMNEKRRCLRLSSELTYCSNFEVFQFCFSPSSKFQYTNFSNGQFAFYTHEKRRLQLFSPFGKVEWYAPEYANRFGRKYNPNID